MDRVTHELRAAIQQENHEFILENYEELRKFLKVRSVDLLELSKKGSVNVCFSVYGNIPKSISREVKPIRYVVTFLYLSILTTAIL